MYTIKIEQIQKLIEINNMLNQLEVKGRNNISIVYTTMMVLQQLLQEIQNNGAVITNTKENQEVS